MNNEEIEKMFQEAACKVREISGIKSFEYPASYINFYKKALEIDSWDRENGEWILHGGAFFVQEIMNDLQKRGVAPYYVPIAQYRDSAFFAFLSIKEPNSVITLSPYAPDISADIYTLDEFLSEMWNSHYW